MNDTGKPCTEVGRRVCHNSAPVFTSTAWNTRSRSPTNATPPAVESTAVRNGARCVTFQISFMVFTSYAASLPTLPFDPGHLKEAPVRGGAARAFLEIRLAPEHFHAGLAERNDELRRCRVIAHGLPVVPAFGRGTRLHPRFRTLLDDIVAVVHLARLLVDAVEDVLVHGFLVVKKLAGLAIQLPQDAVLADGEHADSARRRSTSTRS